jgi:hypothetical protein
MPPNNIECLSIIRVRIDRLCQLNMSAGMNTGHDGMETIRDFHEKNHINVRHTTESGPTPVSMPPD